MPTSRYLPSTIALFKYYKTLGEKTFDQLEDKDLFMFWYDDANNIAIIVKHLWGNMRSRWTDFLTSDGEKEWRQRDTEFEATISSREEMMTKWNEGWQILFDALAGLSEDDLARTITIRGEQHLVFEAILRQQAHYAYHIGQIVFIGRNIKGRSWSSLSIPKRESKAYNASYVGKIKSADQSIWEK